MEKYFCGANNTFTVLELKNEIFRKLIRYRILLKILKPQVKPDIFSNLHRFIFPLKRT
jgi:hypothetical protein